MIKFNKIIKPITIILLTLSVMSCSNDDTISGSGQLVTVSREVEEFDAIQNMGVIDVKVVHGDQQKLEITADDNLINYLISNVENGRLKLFLNDNYNYENINASVAITIKELKKVQNTGSGRMNISGIKTNKFSIKNEGSGRIDVQGIADEFILDIEGSGDIYGFELDVEDCYAQIHGSGNLEISCAQLLDVEIEGSGNVFYKGSPTIDTEINGSGKVVNSN